MTGKENAEKTARYNYLNRTITWLSPQHEKDERDRLGEELYFDAMYDTGENYVPADES